MTPGVFVDTSAFVALIRRNDEHHQNALIIAERLKQQRIRLYTTNFVIAEMHAGLLRYVGAAVAREFLQNVEAGRVAVLVVRAKPDDEAAARATIYRQTDKDYSLTDAISFAVMTRLGIREAWVVDKHFGQYGWQVLAP